MALETPFFVFLRFTDDRVGQVGRETKSRRQECGHGTVHALEMKFSKRTPVALMD